MFVVFKRILKSGWLSFTRDGGIAAATIFILVLAIFLVSTIFVFKDVSQFLISSLKEKADISVYFKEEAMEEDILNVKETIAKIPEVSKVSYVSKEVALQDFKERHKDTPILLESLEEVGGNPFLASLSIKAQEASQYGKIAEFLENSSFNSLIEKIDYYQRKPIIDKIFSLTSFVSKAVILLSIILITIAILVTFNTIRLAILNSGEEIKIQRLVGASNWFIRGPFLVQGAISGIFATIICLLIFALICWFFGPRVEFLSPGLNLFVFFTKNFWILLLLQLITGIGLGVLSSSIAIRKYLKV